MNFGVGAQIETTRQWQQEWTGTIAGEGNDEIGRLCKHGQDNHGWDIKLPSEQDCMCRTADGILNV